MGLFDQCRFLEEVIDCPEGVEDCINDIYGG